MEYRLTTDMVVAAFGKDRLVDDLAADDFGRLRAAMAERWGPVRLGNAITRVKSVFKYGLDNALLERVPRYGSEFRKPDKAVLRRHRAANGKKMLEADQLRGLIGAADVQLRAMILLGVNAGFGNGDCATLPLPALDLGGGWVDYPRPKTGIARRCWLWPETVRALREVLAKRPQPKGEAGDLVFVNSRGSGWIHFTDAGGRIDNVTIQFGLLLKKLGMHRAGLGFYTLRHVFRTVADAARDPVAIDLIMGHTDPSMAAHYRERIDDARLWAVADHVHAWLFGGAPHDGTDDEAGAASPETSTPGDPPHQDESDGRPVLRLFAG
jgi:integrase